MEGGILPRLLLQWQHRTGFLERLIKERRIKWRGNRCRLERRAQRLQDLDLGADLIHQDFRGGVAGIRFAFDDHDLAHLEHLLRLLPGFRKEHKLDVALHVFHRHKAHGFVGLGHVRTHSRDQTGHPHSFLMLSLRQLPGEIADDLCERLLVWCEGMVGDI